MILNSLLIGFCVLSIIFSLLIIISKNPIHSILYLILVFCTVTFVMIILGIEFIAITFLIVYVGAIAVLFLFVVMMLNIKVLELDETFWKYIPAGLIISSIFLFQIFTIIFDWGWYEIFTSMFDARTLFETKYLHLTVPSAKFAFPTTHYVISGIYGPQKNLIDPAFLLKIVDFETLHILYPKLSNTSDWLIFFPNTQTSTQSIILSSEFTNTEILGWVLYTYTFFVFLVVSLILLVAMLGSIVLVLNQNINVKRQLIFKQTLKDLNSSVVLKK